MAPAHDATSPLFDYTLAPSEGFVALQATLTLTVTNNSGDTVTMQGGRDGDMIAVTFPVPPDPNPLTDTTGFNATSLTAGFLAGVSPSGANVYTIVPNGTQVVGPGASIVVQFGPITLDSTAGPATLQIQEFIGTNEGDTTLGFTKRAQELAVIAWAQPMSVGQNQPATIMWQSFAGTKVTVSGLPSGDKEFPVTGEPPYPGSLKVTLLRSDAQRNYTVRVSTNDQRHAETLVTVTQVSPVITFRTVCTPPDPLPLANSVTFAWTSAYASDLRVQNSAGLPDRRLTPSDSAYTVTPGLDAANALWPASVPSQIGYTLVAQGYSGPARKTIGFDLGRVQLGYFRFATKDGSGALSDPKYALIPSAWPSSMTTGPDGLNVLTIQQPGGTSDLYYLGPTDKVHPQIQYIEYQSGDGGGVLSWITANLVSLTVQGTPIDKGQISQGSLKVPGGGAGTVYTFMGTGSDGTEVPSQFALHS
jgi:hypothetical protein